MDLESVMCELAGPDDTSLLPLLSLEREQFMCQVIGPLHRQSSQGLINFMDRVVSDWSTSWTE